MWWSGLSLFSNISGAICFYFFGTLLIQWHRAVNHLNKTNATKRDDQHTYSNLTGFSKSLEALWLQSTAVVTVHALLDLFQASAEFNQYGIYVQLSCNQTYSYKPYKHTNPSSSEEILCDGIWSIFIWPMLIFMI